MARKIHEFEYDGKTYELNQKEFDFCVQYLANDCNQTIAYNIVYGKDDIHDLKSVSRASKMAKRDSVVAYIKRANEEAVNELIPTIVDRKLRLAQIMKVGEDKDVIRAVDLLNKMEKVYNEDSSDGKDSVEYEVGLD